MLSQDWVTIIEAAHQAMLSQSDHALAAHYRKQIYDTLEGYEQSSWRLFYTILSIVSAEHVLPMWEQQWAENKLPRLALLRTYDLLLGYVQMQDIIWEANETQELLQGFQRAPVGKALGSSFWAAYAAADTLFAASGARPFNDEPSDMSEFGAGPGDTAGLAVIAYAGHLADEVTDTRLMLTANDPVRRQEFWTWWLKEAIPLAINRVRHVEHKTELAIEAQYRRISGAILIPEQVSRVLAIAQDMGFKFPYSVYDFGSVALHYASHKEVTLAVADSSQVIAVANCICDVCQDFLWRLSLHLEQPILVADCIALREFRSGMQSIYAGYAVLRAIRAGLTEQGLATEDWHTWSSEQLVWSLMPEAPDLLRRIVFHALLKQFEFDNEFISEQLEKVEHGDISPDWTSFYRIISSGE